MSVEKPNVEPEGCGCNVAPYVLGALTEEEHAAFSRHVESCAVCREEVAALQVVAAALPAAAPQVSAPAELKQRVMASVYAEAREREARERAEEAPTARERGGARGGPRQGARRPRALAGAGEWLRWRPNLAVGALAAAVVALAAVALTTGGSAPGTRVIQAQVLVPRASASLRVNGGQAQLDVADMPQAGPGRVYEVWRERSGSPQPTDALFTVSADGSATVSVPGGVAGLREVLVTSEPLGGSRVPTRTPVIVAGVS
ncbi:MAG TPA: anti-sigma factor [Solirubrobacteraceae bacterium]|jgi:hypothetical protein|nr:anti-sigma factor [Solirubrobacteraceae bacterium]